MRVGDEDKFFALKGGGDLTRGGVGVDVEFAAGVVACDGGDDGDVVGLDDGFDELSVDALDFADVADVDFAVVFAFEEKAFGEDGAAAE